MKKLLAVTALVLTAACGPFGAGPDSDFEDFLAQVDITPDDMDVARDLARSLCAKLDEGYGPADLMAMYGDLGNGIKAKRPFMAAAVAAYCPEYGN